MSALFSIVIPIYNVAPYLRRAVKSVQAQTFTDWEIVLVDDGSTDGSGALCDQLSTEDTRVKVVHQNNQGVVVARQNGFRASSGKWILFLDGDDELNLGLLEQLTAFIDGDNPDIIRFAFEMGREGQAMTIHAPQYDESFYLVGDLIKAVRKTPLEIVEMCIGDKLYRREVCAQAFAEVGGLHIKHSEDGLFAFAALMHVEAIRFSKFVGYRYLLRGGSAVHKFNPELADEKVVFLSRILKLFKASRYYSEPLFVRMKAYHAYESLAFIYSRVLRWRGSTAQVRQLLASLKKTPFVEWSRPEIASLKRKLMIILLEHPTMLISYRLVFRTLRGALCE